MAKKEGKKLSRELADTSRKVKERYLKKKKKKVSKKLMGISTPETAVNATLSPKKHALTLSKRKENGEGGSISGFIFMCNGKTKHECYRYRVFGLPSGKVNALEKIKPGAMLFLFDVDLKLLYGMYKATSRGEVGLEPNAFSGKFPSQVRFKIYKDCLPLRENTFKHAIRDNYDGAKFRQELNRKQVQALGSLFRSIESPTVPSALLSNSAPSPSFFVDPVQAESIQLPARLPLLGDPYAPPVSRAILPPGPDPRSLVPVGPTYEYYLHPRHHPHLQTVRDPQPRSVPESVIPTALGPQYSEPVASVYYSTRSTNGSHMRAMVDHQQSVQESVLPPVPRPWSAEPGSPIYDHRAQTTDVSHVQSVHQVPHPHHSINYFPTEAHGPSIPEKSSLDVHTYARYGAASETATYGVHYPVSQIPRGPVTHWENAADNYPRGIAPSSALHASGSPVSDGAPSRASFSRARARARARAQAQAHVIGERQSSHRLPYYGEATNENSTLMHARSALHGANAYSFAGATQTYRRW